MPGQVVYQTAAKPLEDAAMMSLSLYDASVLTYLQTLDAVSGFMSKALAHFKETNVDPETIVETSLYLDMRPLRFQIGHIALHSRGAVEAILAGELVLPGRRPDLDYAGLQGLIAETRSALRQVDPDMLNACEGQEVVFAAPNRPIRVFTAESFLMSFSLPNFYFHATTAYDILRSQGAPLGKADFIGEFRLKG
jgi:hypothetical protein